MGSRESVFKLTDKEICNIREEASKRLDIPKHIRVKYKIKDKYKRLSDVYEDYNQKEDGWEGLEWSYKALKEYELSIVEQLSDKLLLNKRSEDFNKEKREAIRSVLKYQDDLEEELRLLTPTDTIQIISGDGYLIYRGMSEEEIAHFWKGRL